MSPVIDRLILEGIRTGQIRVRGGYTTDTTWGITFSGGRFSKFRYDDEGKEVIETISESEVLQTLEGSGLRRRIIEKHQLERLAEASPFPETERHRTVDQREGEAH